MMTGKNHKLDIDLMEIGATYFVGKHNFKKYTIRASKNTIFEREILSSEIVKNDFYIANFFPKQSFIYKVTDTGFMRYQVRMMIGLLFLLGNEKITLETLKKH